MNKVLALVIAGAFVCGACGYAWGGRTTVELGSQHVSVRSADDRNSGAHFVMAVDVPGEIASEALLGAILEFAVDSDTHVDTVWVEDGDTLRAVVRSTPVPLLEVFALTSSTGSALDAERWNRDLSFPVPVGVGSGRMVRIDITRLVKHIIENPEQNHGIVIGSLTGDKFGMFTLSDGFGAGVKARIRYVYGP